MWKHYICGSRILEGEAKERRRRHSIMASSGMELTTLMSMNTDSSTRFMFNTGNGVVKEILPRPCQSVWRGSEDIQGKEAEQDSGIQKKAKMYLAGHMRDFGMGIEGKHPA